MVYGIFVVVWNKLNMRHGWNSVQNGLMPKILGCLCFIFSVLMRLFVLYQVQKTRNWPLASAFSMVLTLVSTAGVLWMMLASKKEASLSKSKEQHNEN